MATCEEKVYIYIYDNDTNKYLRSETHTLTEEISGDSIAIEETLAYKTYGTTYVMGHGWKTTSNEAFFHPDTITMPDDGKISFNFVNRKYVPDFSWTDDDAAKIKAGEPTTNLRAEDFNKAITLLNGDLSRLWWSRLSISPVSAGDEITFNNTQTVFSNIINTLRCALGFYGVMPYRQNIFARKGAPIQATQFANHEYSAKSAINKIIQYMRP